MKKTETILVSGPAKCPLRKINHPTDKFFCVIVNEKFKTIHCPSSTEFPAECRLNAKNIIIGRDR